MTLIAFEQKKKAYEILAIFFIIKIKNDKLTEDICFKIYFPFFYSNNQNVLLFEGLYFIKITRFLFDNSLKASLNLISSLTAEIGFSKKKKKKKLRSMGPSNSVYVHLTLKDMAGMRFLPHLCSIIISHVRLRRCREYNKIEILCEMKTLS